MKKIIVLPMIAIINTLILSMAMVFYFPREMIRAESYGYLEGQARVKKMKSSQKLTIK